jgi:hypothetical protein
MIQAEPLKRRSHATEGVGFKAPQIGERVPVQDALRDQRRYRSTLLRLGADIFTGRRKDQSVTTVSFRPGTYSTDQRSDGFLGVEIFSVGSPQIIITRDRVTGERGATYVPPETPVGVKPIKPAELDKAEFALTEKGICFFVPTPVGERVIDFSTADFDVNTPIAKTGPFTSGVVRDHTPVDSQDLVMIPVRRKQVGSRAA